MHLDRVDGVEIALLQTNAHGFAFAPHHGGVAELGVGFVDQFETFGQRPFADRRDLRAMFGQVDDHAIGRRAHAAGIGPGADMGVAAPFDAPIVAARSLLVVHWRLVTGVRRPILRKERSTPP